MSSACTRTLHSSYASQCHQQPALNVPRNNPLRYKRQLKALDNLADVESLFGFVLTLSVFAGATFPLLGVQGPGSIARWEITVARTFPLA